MEMEQKDENNIHEGKKKKGAEDKDAAKDEKDYKEFLDEIEEDPEMRQNIMLFKVIYFLFTILFRMRKLLVSWKSSCKH